MEEKLNLVRQFRAFGEKKDGKLKAAAIALYYALLETANEASHEGGTCRSVRIDNARLMKRAGIGSERTLAIQRKALQEGGFIEYEAGGKFVEGKRIPGKYKLLKLY